MTGLPFQVSFERLGIEFMTPDLQGKFCTTAPGRRGGLVVERRIPEREVGDAILTRVAMLYP